MLLVNVLSEKTLKGGVNYLYLDEEFSNPPPFDKMETAPRQRTSQQNRALHLYLTQVANELDRQGHTLQDVVAKINKVEITPTMHNIKEVVFREIMKAMLGKDSTAFLAKQEIDQVYEVMNKWLGLHFQIHIPFPNDEQKQWEKNNYGSFDGEKIL